MKHSCKYSDCNFHSNSQRSFIYHIKKEHKIKNLEEYYLIFNNKKPLCIICNKNTASWDQTHFSYREVCSNKSCIGKYAHNISSINFKLKYGVDNPAQLESVKKKTAKTKKERYGSSTYNNMEKNKQTCIDRYDVDNGSKSESAKQKISDKYEKSDKEQRKTKTIETFQKNYGVDWLFSSDIIKDKKKKTYLKNWGVDHPMKNKEFIEKRKENFMNIYGVEFMSQMPEFRNKMVETNFKKRKNILLEKFNDIIIDFPNKNLVKIKCPKCGKESIINYGFMLQRDKFDVDLCLHCTPYRIPSYVQLKISNWIKELGFEVLNDYKIPDSKKEMDIYIPDKKIAIEFNGIYWHSDKFKDKYYHIDKKINGIKNNINIINIWEDDYIMNKELIENKIKHILDINIKKIGAIECYIKEVNNKEAKMFLNKNHIRGFLNSIIYIGLYYNNEIISVLSLGRRNGLKENEWEIFRFASISNYEINGLFNKLLKYFETNYTPKKLIAYIDLDWANFRNNIYEKNGFTFINQTEPEYFYVVGEKRENKQKYQKHKLVKMGYDKNKTELQIMNELGYQRIWDCGNLKYLKEY